MKDYEARINKDLEDEVQKTAPESNNSASNIKKVEEKEEETRESIRISVKERGFVEIVAWLFYRILRAIYVSVWFYFSPFFAMSLQFILPVFTIEGTECVSALSLC